MKQIDGKKFNLILIWLFENYLNYPSDFEFYEHIFFVLDLTMQAQLTLCLFLSFVKVLKLISNNKY